MRVQWSRRATTDLQQLAEFLREQSTEREAAITTQLITSSQQLAAQPRLGQRREVPEETGEIRTLLVSKTYRLVYEIIDEERVIILQVLDVRRNNTFYR